VSFGVWKKASQTVTVEGANTEVSVAGAGVTANGSEGADDELALFTVKTERWDPDTRTSTMFYGTGKFEVGGDTYDISQNKFTDTRQLVFAPFTFDLVVEEPGYDSITVAVTVNVETDLTGVAIFKVENNSLQRVPKEDIKKWNDPAQQGNAMIDAIAWIDRNNTDDGQYLVRVESSEAIPKTVISGRAENADTEIRLRGIGAEWEISHDGNIASTPAGTARTNTCYNTDLWSGSQMKPSERYGLINLYDKGDRPSYGSLTLAIEDKLTLMGTGFDNPNSNFYLTLWLL
jgi:hypothetical protein